MDSNTYGITQIVTTDLNQNGFQYIIISQKYHNNHKISYFLNSGSQSFGTQTILTMNVNTPESIAAGDLNGDG
jgi:hypothetical protein